MELLDILKEARTAITHPDAWAANFCEATEDDSRMCLIQAINWAQVTTGYGKSLEAVAELAGLEHEWHTGPLGAQMVLSEFNDSHSHAEVLGFLDEQISKLESATATLPGEPEEVDVPAPNYEPVQIPVPDEDPERVPDFEPFSPVPGEPEKVPA